MKKFFLLLLLAFAPISVFAAPAVQNAVSIPPAEQPLLSQTAREWLLASPASNILEGAIFDKDGNLLFCDVSGRKVMRLTPKKQLSQLLELGDMPVGGLSFHPDGRLFMAALDLTRGRGAILAFSPETGSLETIIPESGGYWPNDLVFDRQGGFYFSDFRGNASNPAGGVYYVSPDFQQITPVIANLCQANGVALSPDGKTLWATEFAKNRLHRAQLQDAATISPTGSAIPYQFIGPAPDSMRVDQAGNVYVALYGQGRVLIFNNMGIPVGQVLLPDREKGRNLLSTSLAVRPDGEDLFIVTSDEAPDMGARIFRAKSLAPGQPPQIGENQTPGG